MKKILSLLTALGIFAGGLCTAVQAADDFEAVLQIDNPIMTVNGEEKEIDPGRGTMPVIENERTLLPVRAVVEEMGGTVGWDAEAQEATLTLGEDTIRLTIGSTTAYLNDEAQNLDAAPMILNDRTMLPIRFIAESFDFDVDWNPETEEIVITKFAEEVQQPEEEVTEEEPSMNETEGSTTEQPAETEEEETVSDTNNTLVVYFSATGNTEALAQTIAETVGADICEIVPSDPYTSEDLDYNSDCRANEEQQDDSARPEIEELAADIDEYDTIILGYPIWWGTLPKVIYTFAETYDMSGKTIMPFCTSGGSGISSSVSALRSLCPQSNVTDGMRGNAGTTPEQVMTWLEECGYVPALSETAA